MKLKNDVEYCISKTLQGKQLIVGIKKLNSSIKFGSSNINLVVNFIEKVKGVDIESIQDSLSYNEQQLLNLFESKGYLDNGREVKVSFNEFTKVGHAFFKKDMRQIKALNKVSFSVLIIILVLISIGIIVANHNFIPYTINYRRMKVSEIALSIIVVPIVMFFLHEITHYICAQIVGVKVNNIALGFLTIYPIMLVSYEGLHFYSTTKKVYVELGGIFGNLFGIAIGIVLRGYGCSSVIIDIWILGNFSSILTNLSIYGMTDGYFILTTVTGFMNFRLKGYKFCWNLMKRKRNFDKQEIIIGLLLIGMYFLSLVMMIIQFKYVGNLFNISSVIINLVSIIFAITITIRLFKKIGELNLQ